jgi:uncharacterized membrane protein YfcA
MVARKSCSPVLSGGVLRRYRPNWASLRPMASPAAIGAMLAVATIPLHLLLSKMQPEQFGTSILVMSIVNFFYTVINQYK